MFTPARDVPVVSCWLFFLTNRKSRRGVLNMHILWSARPLVSGPLLARGDATQVVVSSVRPRLQR
ncbi:hypothetical protein E2C01_082648 [Portunus trituberculatus]|uniref:Uncharacterized protein n=1 Tax=Portunus trituberculatus TaxID=210409 RepID=A0A5B7IZ09_PORTR|nr:hypothetical protein [Portunus trituberculatus]